MKNKKIEKTPIYQRLLALLLIILFSPLLILISLISFIDTKRNPIFIQERGLSLRKYRFKLIKFRTIKSIELNGNEQSSPSILKKSYYYDSISSIGKYLRKTGLDELPQLINILLGQMKFIGPRALSIEDLERIKTNFPELYMRRDDLKSIPGIIGLWQVNKDFECTVNKLIELDEEYEKNKSFIIHLKILIKTLNIILLGYHIDSVVNGKKLKIYPVFIYGSIASFIFMLYLISYLLGG